VIVIVIEEMQGKAGTENLMSTGFDPAPGQDLWRPRTAKEFYPSYGGFDHDHDYDNERG